MYFVTSHQCPCPMTLPPPSFSSPFSIAKLLLLQVAFTSCWLPLIHGYGSTTTLASLWGPVDAPFIPTPMFCVCAIEVQTLTPTCFGTYSVRDDMSPPNETLWALSSGGYFTCGLTADRHYPVCWGWINSSQIPASMSQTSYGSIAAGGFHACAVRSTMDIYKAGSMNNSTEDGDGVVDCWGDNSDTQANPFPGVKMAMVTAGDRFSCGLTVPDMKPVCWGLNITALPGAVPDPPDSTSFLTISAGNGHVCGITTLNGTAICWGNNTSNQALPPSGLAFSAISCGYAFSCGILAETQQVFCWGDNSLGQLEAPYDVRFSAISAGDYYACGVMETSKVLCWGLRVSSATDDKLLNKHVPPDLNVTQGVCTTHACDAGQEALAFNYNTSRQCYKADERLCVYMSNKSLLVLPQHIPSMLPEPPTRDSFDLGSKPAHRWYWAITVIMIVISSISLFALFLSILMRYLRRRRSTPHDPHSWSSKVCTIVAFTSQDLQMVTANYNPKMVVGHGAFCNVYVGVLPSGQEVAIKKAHALDDSALSFEMELQLLSRLHHKCLVNLVGYCQEEKVLVFEYMANGSLYDCLFTNRSSILLNWRCRMRVALQAARGLEYLHVYASPRVIHRDVKSANVLLDKVWNAHLGDFGLSLNGPLTNRSHLSNQFCIGTEGFLDPDCPFPYKLTAASDVYSFGVVLLELLSGRESLGIYETDGASNFTSLVPWAVHLASQGRHLDILDTKIEIMSDMAHGSLVLAIKLALGCVKQQSKERPSITKVVTTLQAIFDALDRNMEVSNLMVLVNDEP